MTSGVVGPKFDEAVRYARELHHDQVRKGTQIPYLSHLLGAAALVLDQGGDEDEVIAALLHDALEDQPERTSYTEIAGRFGEKTARIVLACSDAVEHPKPPWRARKERYLAHLRDQPEDVLRVSLADKLHNARSIVADWRVIGDDVWSKFSAARHEQVWYYSSLLEVFERRAPSPLVTELAVAVQQLRDAAQA